MKKTFENIEAARDFVAHCRPIGAPYSDARKRQAGKLKLACLLLGKTEKEAQSQFDFLVAR